MPSHHRAHLRHLPGEPPAGIGQGVRRHHGGGAAAAARQTARADALRAVRAVATRSASSISPRRTCCWASTTTPRAATSSASSTRIRSWPEPGSALRKFGQEIIEGLAKERVHPSLDRARRRQRAADAGGSRAHPGRSAGGARRGRSHAGSLQKRARPLPGRDRPLRLRPNHVRGPRRRRRGPDCTTAFCFRDPRARWRRRMCAPATTPGLSARPQCAIPT